MNKTAQCVVYETTDYKQFKRLKGNRDIEQVEKIVKSIKDIGYVFNPIIVNEKKEVIDGQNRLGALEKLGLPVHYYIVKKADINTARRLNLGRTNWKPIDYVKSYAESGEPSYQLLLKLVSENKGYTLSQIVGIAQNHIINGGGAITQMVCDGTFELDEETYERTQYALTKVKQIEPALANIKGSLRTVTTGIAWCLGVKGCNEKRLISRINRYVTKIRPVVSVDEFLYDVSKIYNKDIAPNNAIDFDVEYRRERRTK